MVATKTSDSSVELSAKLKDEIASVGFDSNKVDHIKQSIEQGNYPLDDRKIADSFIPLKSYFSTNFSFTNRDLWE